MFISEKIYETKKMQVVIAEEKVTKVFKHSPKYKVRYKQEKRALQCFESVSGFPQLIQFDDTAFTLVTNTLPGLSKEQLTESEVMQVRQLIDKAVSLGVARLSLPVRDLLIDNNGIVNMVDFERSIIRETSNPILWFFAKKVSVFHSIRFVNNYYPELLSNEDKLKLERYQLLRKPYLIFKETKQKIRRYSRK